MAATTERPAVSPRMPLQVKTVAAPPSHTVQPGDTISAIAQRNGLRTADVLAWNGLGWSSIIRPGQVIVLAAPAAVTAEPATTPAAPTADAHTVVAGDTLWAIAHGAGIPVAALLAANGLGDGSIIYPGQVLTVPTAATLAAAAATSPTAPSPAEHVTLDAEQIANARVIIEVGRSRGVSDRGIAIALATAMVESWIRNLDWGDRDSLGLFQQRPSAGWGTEDEVRDPARAAAAFFGGPDDPNGPETRGLLDIAGWQDMAFGDAAQAVQISACPERYAPWEQQAYEWLAAYGGAGAAQRADGPPITGEPQVAPQVSRSAESRHPLRRLFA